MPQIVKKTVQEINLDTTAEGLKADHFSTDAHGNLTIKNADLSNLIKSNVQNAIKNKQGQAAISVGITVGT